MIHDKGWLDQFFFTVFLEEQVDDITLLMTFFIFNMIPIPPLDGSRALYALAPDVVRRAMSAIEQYGIVLIFALVMFGSQFFVTFIRETMTAILSVYSAIFGV